jgi:hypothetical protein
VKYSILFLFLLVISMPAQASNPDFKVLNHDKKIYVVSRYRMNWAAAKSFCQNHKKSLLEKNKLTLALLGLYRNKTHVFDDNVWANGGGQMAAGEAWYAFFGKRGDQFKNEVNTKPVSNRYYVLCE